MTTFPTPLDQQFPAGIADIKQRLALLEQQMVQATSNVPQPSTPDSVPPTVQGLAAWNFDSAAATVNNTPGSAQLLLMAIQVPIATTISNVVIHINVAGSGLTAGRNLVGLYNAAGTRLAQSADQSANWTSTGDKIIPIGSTALAATKYYVAMLPTGTTPPTPACCSFQANNAGQTAAPYRFNTFGTQTALPSSLTMSSGGPTGEAPWVGLL